MERITWLEPRLVARVAVLLMLVLFSFGCGDDNKVTGLTPGGTIIVSLTVPPEPVSLTAYPSPSFSVTIENPIADETYSLQIDIDGVEYLEIDLTEPRYHLVWSDLSRRLFEAIQSGSATPQLHVLIKDSHGRRGEALAAIETVEGAVPLVLTAPLDNATELMSIPGSTTNITLDTFSPTSSVYVRYQVATDSLFSHALVDTTIKGFHVAFEAEAPGVYFWRAAVTGYTQASTTPSWVGPNSFQLMRFRRHNSSSDIQYLHSMTEDGAGGIYVTVNSDASHVSCRRFGADGAQAWDRTVDLTNGAAYSGTVRTSLVAKPANGFLLVHSYRESSFPTSSGQLQARFHSFDSSGIEASPALIPDLRLDGTSITSVIPGLAACSDGSGGLYHAFSYSYPTDHVVAHTRSDGTTTRLVGLGTATIWDVDLVPVTGHVQVLSSQSDARTARYDSTGTLRWSRDISILGRFDAYEVQQAILEDGSTMVVGAIQDPPVQGGALYVGRFGIYGGLIFEREIDPVGDDTIGGLSQYRVTDALTGAQGGVIVAAAMMGGSSYYYGTRRSLLVLNIDAWGDTVWWRTISFSNMSVRDAILTRTDDVVHIGIQFESSSYSSADRLATVLSLDTSTDALAKRVPMTILTP